METKQVESILGLSNKGQLFARENIAFAQAIPYTQPLISVCALADGGLLGVKTDNKVYCWNSAVGIWQDAGVKMSVLDITVTNDFKYLSLGTNGLLYFCAMLDGIWELVDNTMPMIDITTSTDGTIYGVGRADQSIYKKDSISDSWQAVPNTGKIIGFTFMCDGSLLAVGANNDLYLRSCMEGNWYLLPETVPALSVSIGSSNEIVFVGIDQKLYQMDKLPARWFLISNEPISGNTNLVDIAITSAGTYVGVGSDGFLYIHDSIQGEWQQVPDSGGMKGVEIQSNGIIFGVGSNSNLYVRESLKASWQKVTNCSNVQSVACMENGLILAVNCDHQLVMKDTLTEDWTLVSDSIQLNDVAVMRDGSILCVGADGISLYERKTLASPWRKIPNNRAIMDITYSPWGLSDYLYGGIQVDADALYTPQKGPGGSNYTTMSCIVVNNKIINPDPPVPVPDPYVSPYLTRPIGGVQLVLVNPNTLDVIFSHMYYQPDYSTESTIYGTIMADINSVASDKYVCAVSMFGTDLMNYPTAEFSEWLAACGAELQDWREYVGFTGSPGMVTYTVLGRKGLQPGQAKECFDVIKNWAGSIGRNLSASCIAPTAFRTTLEEKVLIANAFANYTPRCDLRKVNFTTYAEIVVDGNTIAPDPAVTPPPPRVTSQFIVPIGGVQLALVDPDSLSVIMSHVYYQPTVYDKESQLYDAIIADINAVSATNYRCLVSVFGVDLMNYPSMVFADWLSSCGATLSSWKEYVNYTGSPGLVTYSCIGYKGASFGQAAEAFDMTYDWTRWYQKSLIACTDVTVQGKQTLISELSI